MVVCVSEECNGGLPEEPDVVRDSAADQEVPHPEVLPEQSGGDFDFNEFFNLEKTMPGLASVSPQRTACLVLVCALAKLRRLPVQGGSGAPLRLHPLLFNQCCGPGR